MVLIAIAVIALHRRIRALIQQRAARRHQQGLAEHPRIPQPAEPTAPTSPDTMPERLVLHEIHAVPGQTDDRTDRRASLVSTSDLVPAVLRAGTIREASSWIPMTGGGIVIKESDEVDGILLMICTITVTRNPAARTNGRSRRCRGPWVIGGATDRRSSARS